MLLLTGVVSFFCLFVHSYSTPFTMQRKLGSYLFASGDRPSARTVFDDRMADVDSLCENDLKDLYKVLMQENIKLNFTNHALLSELDSNYSCNLSCSYV